MEISQNTKPCLVQTPQGFSISYKQKFLYSKYNPAKTILQTLESLVILPGTIVLCNSPVLDYGLLELQKKLPENCILLRCEFDSQLQEFIKSTTQIKNIPLLTTSELYKLPVILNNKEYRFNCGEVLPGAGTYKRVISIDFSAGAAFNQHLYSQLQNACTNAILTWWSNRVTLVKFGRRYSNNFFRNLKNLADTTPISNYINKIERPIIVCGAGESLNAGINDFKDNTEAYFILCADTALQPLLAHGIKPDGVFIEEAQQIITNAFIGLKDSHAQIFAGLSSVSQLAHDFPLKRISYFTTEYSQSEFINRLKEQNLLPSINQPFGSVGLTAVYYALQFRKNDSVPVFLYGLDFSYSSGITHAKGTMAHKNRLSACNKLQPLQNYAACFNKNSIKINDKNHNCFYTSTVMNNYANLFNSFFENVPNLFDSSESGITLNIPRKKPCITANNKSFINNKMFSKEYSLELKKWFENEKLSLLELKSILTGKKNLPAEKLEDSITQLAKNREYLYLHFPDGWKFQYSQSFLNRIRTEIDFFLKIFD